MKSLQTTVEAYVRCGQQFGFAIAEAILDNFVAPGLSNGKCYDVPEGLRADFIQALEEPEEYFRLQALRRVAADKAKLGKAVKS